MQTTPKRSPGARLVLLAAVALLVPLLASQACNDEETVAANYEQCPNAIPAAGSACAVEGIECPYVDPQGEGNDVCRAHCSGGVWVLDAACQQPSTGGSGPGGAGGTGGSSAGGTGGSSAGGTGGSSEGGGSVGGAGGQLGMAGAGGW